MKIKKLENSEVIDSLAKAQALIKSVPDYPKPGIVFKDITPLIANAQAFTLCVDAMAKSLAGATHVAGLEARGFVFAAAIAVLYFLESLGNFHERFTKLNTRWSMALIHLSCTKIS